VRPHHRPRLDCAAPTTRRTETWSRREAAPRRARAAAALLGTLALAGPPAPAVAQDANVALPVAELERMLRSEPLRIVSAEISRPKAQGDITLKAEVAFGGRPPLRVKLRKAEPGAEAFNNVPRYDLAAYEVQKLLVDGPEYLVPPTALRMIPLAELRPYSPAVDPTFKGSDEVLCVVQYWLQEVRVTEDVLDGALYATDPVYARHIGQLNAFTYLIRHGDSNLGNFLLSRAPSGPRVFSVDNGVAFAAEESDRGKLWQRMRVERLPADTVERMRWLGAADLRSQLGVLAQWQLEDGRFVSVKPGANLAPRRGVRRTGGTLQMGLTESEIDDVRRRALRLLKTIDDGAIGVD
jgi:hypothetical protein